MISAAGPGIQLLLAALVIVLVYATGGKMRPDTSHILPLPVPVLRGALADNVNLAVLVSILININIFCALMNLLPVLPLDGGQIAMQFLVEKDPWGGMTRALWLSIFTGAAVAALAL